MRLVLCSVIVGFALVRNKVYYYCLQVLQNKSFVKTSSRQIAPRFGVNLRADRVEALRTRRKHPELKPLGCYNFIATSHGKSTCDGLGGTLKRLAAKASLQRPLQDQITNARELFLWAEKELKNMNVCYVDADSILEEEKLLTERYSQAIPITGTQKFHAFLPTQKGKLKAKAFSAASESNEYTVGTFHS